jgi:hypothetical protein
MRIRIIEESDVVAGDYSIIGGAFRSRVAALRRAQKSIVKGAVVIHFTANDRLGTPEGWWYAVPRYPRS